MIKVSVIMPVYNGEKFIERTSGMILNQSLKEIELILVNDGSKDNSAAFTAGQTGRASSHNHAHGPGKPLPHRFLTDPPLPFSPEKRHVSSFHFRTGPHRLTDCTPHDWTG